VCAAGIHSQQINQYQIMDKKTKTVQFQKEKDTKNTVKFAEVQNQGEAPIIGSLYVQKWFAGDATNLKVTVEVQ
jgi:antirestriction protein